MAGTVNGGRKAALTNLAKDPDFYKKIGRRGGTNGHTGGFYGDPELARIAGAKGGRISRRGKNAKARVANDFPKPYIKENFIGRLFRRFGL